MANYATEEEQLEALKRWWQENGRAVILGVAIGVLALAGWRGWEMYTEQRAFGASGVYDRLLHNLEQGAAAGVIESAEILRDDYAGTTYAALGALAAAGVAVGDGDLETAEQWLRRARELADDGHVDVLAGARLARVLHARGESDRALELLDAEVPAAFTALYAEIRGDILRDQGDSEGAVAAYQRALDAEIGPSNRGLVERKLNRVRGEAAAATADADS